MRIPSGSTDRYVYFVAVDSTDLKTRETGLTTFTVYRSRNGGAAAAMTTPTINETDTTNMPGVYELLLDEDTTLDAGDDTQEMVFHITQASMAPVTRVVEIYRPETTEGNTAGVESDGHVHGDLKEWLGVAPAALDTQRVQTHVAAMAANVLTATAINADAITAAKIAADAIGASELATDAVNEIRDAILSDSTAFAGANIDAALSTLATPADVNTQVSDVIKTDTIAELAGIADAAATPTLEKAIMLVYMWLRNNTQATATERRIFNDAGTEIMDATMSDDGTTFQQGKLTAP